MNSAKYIQDMLNTMTKSFKKET